MVGPNLGPPRAALAARSHSSPVGEVAARLADVVVGAAGAALAGCVLVLLELHAQPVADLACASPAPWGQRGRAAGVP